jgi:hypothetical protein
MGLSNNALSVTVHCPVSGLSGFEIKSRRFLKLEGHSAFRNFNSTQELRFVAN